MKEVYIVAAVRTPIGSFGGSLKSLTATQLGAIAVENLFLKNSIAKDIIDDVIIGAVLQANMGQAPARQVAKFAGLPDKVNCTTVNKVCASGMKAVIMGAQNIMLGDAAAVVTGGMESMSNVPFYLDTVRWGNKYGNASLIDGLAKDGLTDVYDKTAMGIAAEKCAGECSVSREEQDAYAVESYKRSQAAMQSGAFREEICAVAVDMGKKGIIDVDQDEEPFNVDFDKLPALKPAFMKDGTVTAANASTMNDGAAAMLLMDGSMVESTGVKPLVRIVSYADAEQSPEWFTTSPTLAIEKALKKANLSKDEIDYWEINEAFSVVAIENMRRLGISHEKLNVFGGAVSLGHPLGCSGARIITTLTSILRHKKARYGVASICNGGGGASAIVLENIL